MDLSWLDRSYALDWALVVIWFILSNVFKHLPVFERDFSPEDPIISHKHRPNTVGNTLLHGLSDGIPIAIVVTIAVLRRSLFELHHGLLTIFAGTSLQHLIVNFLKNRVGRLRPDFLDRCQWNGTMCTGTEKLVLDGHRSFPSGHSSSAWVGMTFLFLYFADKTSCFRGRGLVYPARSWLSSALLRFSLCISPFFLSAWIAVTRMEDYRHHKEDVIVGSLIGFVSAWLVFRVYFPDPFAKVGSRESAGEPRIVYGMERRDDGFMELGRLPDDVERGVHRGVEGPE
ncbi:acid phosphatase/Vanadium-dependent haloperoxidase, partial [Serendipita vermifera]